MSLLQWKPGLTRVLDPNAELDFGFDWSDWLEEVPAGDSADTIASSAWTFTGNDASLTLSGSSRTTTTTQIKLASGTLGVTYTLTNRITTAGGRVDDRSILIRIAQR